VLDSLSLYFVTLLVLLLLLLPSSQFIGVISVLSADIVDDCSAISCAVVRHVFLVSINRANICLICLYSVASMSIYNYGANECQFIPSVKANIALQPLKSYVPATGIAGTLVPSEECLDVCENCKISVIIS
jgi:hypothetical protein